MSLLSLKRSKGYPNAKRVHIRTEATSMESTSAGPKKSLIGPKKLFPVQRRKPNKLQYMNIPKACKKPTKAVEKFL